jgi:hypothetical protein
MRFFLNRRGRRVTQRKQQEKHREKAGWSSPQVAVIGKLTAYG